MNYDTQNYRMFTEKSEIDKAISTLHGLVSGIYLDNRLNENELQEFRLWYGHHATLLDRNPFNEIVHYIDDALSDNHLSEEEISDIKWLCQKFQGEFYETVTNGLQQLHGVFHGILADGKVNEVEVGSLRSWMEQHEFLSSYYPFDEVYSLLTYILSDGVVDEDEKLMLKTFLLQFVDLRDQRTKSNLFNELNDLYSFNGICAVDPEVTIQDRKFCITGESSRTSRKEITKIITDQGGVTVKTVSKQINYVLVGDGGNPCWAYSCYGRKIEKAMNLRKEGAPIVILHENDFWDFLENT